MSFQPEHRRTFAGRIRRVSENQAAGRSLFVEIELPAERDAAGDFRAALKNLWAVEVTIPTQRRLEPSPGFIEGEIAERPELPLLGLLPGHSADCRCWKCGQARCEANFGREGEG